MQEGTYKQVCNTTLNILKNVCDCACACLHTVCPWLTHTGSCQESRGVARAAGCTAQGGERVGGLEGRGMIEIREAWRRGRWGIKGGVKGCVLR